MEFNLTFNEAIDYLFQNGDEAYIQGDDFSDDMYLSCKNGIVVMNRLDISHSYSKDSNAILLTRGLISQKFRIIEARKLKKYNMQYIILKKIERRDSHMDSSFNINLDIGREVYCIYHNLSDNSFYYKKTNIYAFIIKKYTTEIAVEDSLYETYTLSRCFKTELEAVEFCSKCNYNMNKEKTL